MARSKIKNDKPLTTAQRLGSLVKSARDIMRKDKGLNGDLDRLPMLTWILFLKFLDDHEVIREDRAKMKKEKYRPVIDAPYRWRDWAAKEDGISGDALRNFINQEETVLPDGSKGAGLIAYLRGLQGSNGDDRRDVIRSVFSGVTNRMESGYLLRDVINKVNGIHFDSTDEIHTLGHLYESMLKEMRDAAGDSGEFYTPRAVVRFMVAVTDPQLGEKILDPACGTGGFLVETYSHLEKQCKTVQQRRLLQDGTIFGGEAKPLPYMLCQMNLLLHGLESPEIAKGNSLEQKLTEIKDFDRVDVILTNPPFGGEEERGIQGNFPEDKQTAETALLFLQLIMRKLKVTPKPGRAAVVVPNGTLFGDGVCARIKQELLTRFNLHTVVRLPNGVFSPYTGIQTTSSSSTAPAQRSTSGITSSLYLILSTARKTDEAEYQRRTVRGEPSVGDIVVVREGGGTGKAGIVEEGQRFSLGQRVMMLRPARVKIEPRYLLYYWLSPLVYEDQIMNRMKGSASPHLNIGAAKKFQVRLPSLDRQREIVAYLDDLRKKTEELCRTQAAALNELQAMMPAILDRAFKGEL